MGVTLIRRDVIAKMVEAYPELIDTRIALHPAGETIKQAGSNRILRFFEKLDLPERGIVSEDLSFCLRWNKLGGKVWAAIGYRMSHVGPFDYSGRYLDVVEAQEQAQFMQQRALLQQQAATPSPSAATAAQIFIPPGMEQIGTSLVTIIPAADMNGSGQAAAA
jgi:hypothetical protein